MRWAKWLVDHAVTVVIMVGVIVTFGVSAYMTLPREAAPDITIPVVVVSTPYFGVSPEDIETLVTVPMERKLKDLKDVDKMTSTSYEGASVVIMEFDPDVDIEDALQKVREKVDAAEADLPEDAEDAQVLEISFSDIPILIVTMTGPLDEEELKELAEDAADEIEAVPGVLEVKVSGGLTREIRVLMDPDRMRLYDLSFGEVMGAISSENVNIPGGNVDARSGDYLLRVPGEFTTVTEIEDVPVKNVGGQTIFVRDVARVVDGYAERATYSRMNGTPSISLSVQKRVGENIVDIAKSTMEVVDAESESWPEGVEHAFIADQSREIEAMVNELENSIITGLLLVVGVLLFFMGFRNSLFVGLAIPLSMLVSFMVLQFMDITLNMVVLFSLILALGMLVDNAIVIVENIYRHVELGKPLGEASVVGVSEVAVPVSTSTLTTVLAFAPMLFWEGIMGQFMGFLPKTLIIVLTSSLFVALIVIPTATSRLMAKHKGEPRDPDELPESGVYAWFLRRYKRVLEWSIDNRYVSFFVFGGGSMIATVAAYVALNHGTEFFPSTEPARAVVQITMPDGTRIETTDQVARRIEQTLMHEPDVDTFVTEVGVAGGSGGLGIGGSSVPHAARITIDFKPSEAKVRPGEEPREGSTLAVIERVRKLANQAVGAKVVVDKEEMGPPVGKPIEVQIKGDDFHALGQVSEQLQRDLAALQPGEGEVPWAIVDIDDDYKVGRPELRLSVDRSAAKNVGTSTGAIGNTVRTAVAGTKASTLRDGDEEYDIVVELAPAYKQDIQSILELQVPGKDNQYIPLSTLASFETRGGSGSISHLDRDKVVTITAEVEGQRVDLAQAAVAALIADYETPDGVTLGMGGANEEQTEAAAFLAKAFGIAVVLIFLVLVTQFDSVTRPFIIMMSVLLSLIGVLWGLILTGTPFGIMMTGVGVISLAGVVVNNAIVLLDYVQQVRDKGVEARQALVDAGLVRFRPVILTAITTVLGLLPMATGVSFDFRNMKLITGGESADFWGPMAVAVCFGLVVATVLTLVMVPTMYSINEDISNFMGRIWKRIAGSNDEGELAQKPLPAKILVFGLVGLGLASAPAQAQERVSLDDALAAAEANNLDLKIIGEQTFQQETMVPMAWSALSPKLVAGANWTYNKDEVVLDFGDTFDPVAMAEAQRFSNYRGVFEALHPGDPTVDVIFDEIQAQEDEAIAEIEPMEPTVVQMQSYYDFNVSVVQPIFNLSALPGLRGAYANREAAYLDQDRNRSLILSGVAKAYYGLVVAREAMAISKDSLDNAVAHLELARRQLAAGAVPPIVELQAELGLSRAERELINAEAQLLEAQQVFANLTGLSPDVEVYMPEAPMVSVGTLNEALASVEMRPDILAADTRIDMAQYQYRADVYGWLPTIQGRFTYSYTQNEGFQGQPDWWMFVVTADWTVWDGGYRLQTNRQYQSQVRMADYAAQKARLDAAQEVRLAWQRYERAEEAFKAVQTEVKLAEQNLVLSTRGFEAGSTTWLEVQDAQLMFDQARIALLMERMNRDLAAIDLVVATGTWQ